MESQEKVSVCQCCGNKDNELRLHKQTDLIVCTDCSPRKGTTALKINKQLPVFKGETWGDVDTYLDSLSEKEFYKIYNALKVGKEIGQNTMRADFILDTMGHYLKRKLIKEKKTEERNDITMIKKCVKCGDEFRTLKHAPAFCGRKSCEEGRR